MHSWLLDNYNYTKNLIDNDNFPNCLIISGNKSIGKDYLAKAISSYYLKTDVQNLENEPNFKYISRDEGSKIIKIEQVRDIFEYVYLQANKRVIYIKDGDNLNINGSNALLKIIEEPPNGTKFIISTSKIQSIIPTIKSRSSILKCNNPTTDDINGYLENIEEVALDNYYVLSNLNSKYVDRKFYSDKFLIINEFFSEIDNYIHSEDNIINVSSKFSAYNIEQLINILLFTIINFQKSSLLIDNSRFFEDNENFLKNYSLGKLEFIYDKLINIKKNINIIQNNETILFSICILFKKTANSS